VCTGILVLLAGCSTQQDKSALIKHQHNINNDDSYDISDIIESRLDVIVSSPKTASYPGAYINEHFIEYDEIVALGDKALQYMFSVFEKGGQTGLRGWIMALACSDIIGEDLLFSETQVNTGQEWYDLYIK